MYINLTWNGTVCVGVAFLCLLCALLLSFATLEWTDQQYCENKDGLYLLPLKLECHNSYNNLLLYDSENGDVA